MRRAGAGGPQLVLKVLHETPDPRLCEWAKLRALPAAAAAHPRIMAITELLPRWSAAGPALLMPRAQTDCLALVLDQPGGKRPLTQVRKTPSWPRSWANFSLL